MALYLPEHNGLFLLSPETDGELVIDALSKTLALPAEHVGDIYSHKDLVGTLRRRAKPFTFTLVRHPVSWYASFWQAAMGRDQQGSVPGYEDRELLWHPTWPIDPSCRSADFGQFIRNVATRRGYLSEMFRWYTGLGTRDQVDLIGKQESITDDLAQFLDALSVPYDRSALPVTARTSTGEPTSVPWTPELRSMLCGAEAQCLRDYGYGADGPLAGPAGVPMSRGVISRASRREARIWQPVATASRRLLDQR